MKNKHNKIPLPWASEDVNNNIREIQTKDYWMLSQDWNGQLVNESFTVQEAIRLSNVILSELDPAKRLAQYVNNLKNDIVVHGTKSRKLKQERMCKHYIEEGNPCKMILL